MSKAFRFHEHGGPEVLRFEEVEVGAPRRGEVRIRNVAIAVNYRDVLMRRGIHAVKSLPSAIGLESAGVIDAAKVLWRKTAAQIADGCPNVLMACRVGNTDGPSAHVASHAIRAPVSLRRPWPARLPYRWPTGGRSDPAGART